MKLKHVTVKAGKELEIKKAHIVSTEMIEGVWHVLTSTGPNTTERTPAMGLTAEFIDE